MINFDFSFDIMAEYAYNNRYLIKAALKGGSGLNQEKPHDRIRGIRMKKTVTMIGALKWLSFLPGLVMYFCTADSFGELAAAVLGGVACGAFWMLMVHEKSRLIGATIANEIQEAITETTEAESIIEIKRMRSGIIARVYLICSRDKAALVNRAVARRMEQCVFKKYLWVMQLTNMAGRGELREMQRILNEQLLEELLRDHREDE